jgi:hypothetical protein
VVNIKIVVLWDVMLSSLVDGFRGTCCFSVQPETGGSQVPERGR